MPLQANPQSPEYYEVLAKPNSKVERRIKYGNNVLRNRW